MSVNFMKIALLSLAVVPKDVGAFTTGGIQSVSYSITVSTIEDQLCLVHPLEMELSMIRTVQELFLSAFFCTCTCAL